MNLLQIELDPETNELILPFPEDLIAKLGWQPGDIIQWTDAGDGRWILEKKESDGKD